MVFLKKLLCFLSFKGYCEPLEVDGLAPSEIIDLQVEEAKEQLKMRSSEAIKKMTLVQEQLKSLEALMVSYESKKKAGSKKRLSNLK